MPRIVKILAPAKINLCLDVLKKHHSGFHEIQTVFHQIDDLYDEIEIVENPRKKSVTIKIKKNIPRGSGLGGESSCIAAILKALNKMWDLKLSTKKLLKIAARFGMDVPFFIIGGTALGTHLGEKITPLKPIKKIKFTISPRSSRDRNKTKNAYKKLNLKKCGLQKSKTKKLLIAIKNGDTKEIVKNFHNDFETITPVKKGEHLSGSGPSVFLAKT